MFSAREIWAWCAALSAGALIFVFGGVYGVCCALIGAALASMDIGDLETSITRSFKYAHRLEANPDALVGHDVEPQPDPLPLPSIGDRPAATNVIPLAIKRYRRPMRSGRRRRASDALARKDEES